MDLDGEPGGNAFCPYCGEPAALEVETAGPAEEQYVEDCPVCCRPWTVRVVRDGGRAEITLQREDD